MYNLYTLTNTSLPSIIKPLTTDRYVPLYLRQNANELTGERSVVMVKPLTTAAVTSEDWIDPYVVPTITSDADTTLGVGPRLFLSV